jgi:hypothetical protein
VYEGYDQIGQHFCIFVLLDRENERDEGLQDGMVELHDLPVSLCQDQGIESVCCEDVADHAQKFELHKKRLTLVAAGSDAT